MEPAPFLLSFAVANWVERWYTEKVQTVEGEVKLQNGRTESRRGWDAGGHEADKWAPKGAANRAVFRPVTGDAASALWMRNVLAFCETQNKVARYR